MARKQTRREFVKTTAAIGAGYWIANSAQAAPSKLANEEISFACVGVKGKGDSDSAHAAQHGNVLGICDIDENRLNDRAKAEPFAKSKKYVDYRKMLDELEKQIDAVTVSTPDHSHAIAAARAMRMGKHAFVQKPLTHSIEEARVLGDLAREKGLATQMGNQGTAQSGLRRSAEIVRAGGIGKVTEVHVWTNRPVWPQGLDRPEDTPAVPEHIHWEEFLGPAEDRPYHPAYHPFKWRGWWAFGTGALGDMGCHTMNMPFMALDLTNPISVEAETSGHNGETYPLWAKVKYEFAATDERPALTMYWYSTKHMPEEKKPSLELLEGEQRSGSGALLIGDKGKLYSPNDYGSARTMLPKEKFADYKGPEESIPRSPGHFQEWIRAIRGGEPAMSNFADYAGPLTETVLLGNLAIWATGKKIEWDHKNMKAKNAPEVEKLVRKDYTKGFTLHG